MRVARFLVLVQLFSSFSAVVVTGCGAAGVPGSNCYRCNFAIDVLVSVLANFVIVLRRFYFGE